MLRSPDKLIMPRAAQISGWIDIYGKLLKTRFKTPFSFLLLLGKVDQKLWFWAKNMPVLVELRQEERNFGKQLHVTFFRCILRVIWETNWMSFFDVLLLPFFGRFLRDSLEMLKLQSIWKTLFYLHCVCSALLSRNAMDIQPNCKWLRRCKNFADCNASLGYSWNVFTSRTEKFVPCCDK